MLFAGPTDVFAKKEKEKKEEKAPPGPPLPDLVILKSETSLEFVGCSKDEPLFKGVVAIKNRGTARAPALVAAPLTAGYIPENLDMKDEDIDPNSLNINEILTKEITGGKGEVKDGRGFNTSRTVYIVVDPYNKVEESNENNNLEKRTIKFKCK
jgi:hypothetical protein